MKNFARNSFKIIGRGFCRLLVLPVYLIYGLSNIFLQKEKNFQGFSQFFSLFPGILGEYLRREFYRLTLESCSKDCCISFGTIFTSPQASIGEGVYIGAYCVIGDVVIGDATLIGSCVEIINGAKQHYFESLEVPIREQGGEYPKVFIGEDCWIGDGALVLTHVGKKSIIGVRSLVNKEIPEYSVAIGSPARVVRSRKTSL